MNYTASVKMPQSAVHEFFFVASATVNPKWIRDPINVILKQTIHLCDQIFQNSRVGLFVLLNFGVLVTEKKEKRKGKKLVKSTCQVNLKGDTPKITGAICLNNTPKGSWGGGNARKGISNPKKIQMCTIGSVQFGFLPPTKEEKTKKKKEEKEGKMERTELFFLGMCECVC